MSALESMDYPITAAQPQQFLFAMQWLHMAIPECARLLAPLHDVLEKAYATTSSRTKRAAARVQLQNVGWGHDESKAFDECKNAIRNQITLAHPDYSQRLCL